MSDKKRRTSGMPEDDDNSANARFIRSMYSSGYHSKKCLPSAPVLAVWTFILTAVNYVLAVYAVDHYENCDLGTHMLMILVFLVPLFLVGCFAQTICLLVHFGTRRSRGKDAQPPRLVSAVSILGVMYEIGWFLLLVIASIRKLMM